MSNFYSQDFMIQFIKTESFIQRIWSVTVGLSVESVRPKFMHFDEQALLEEQAELKSQYDKFLLELEYNLKILSTDNYAQFFNELEKLFLIPIPVLDTANQLLKSYLAQYGPDYQEFAWKKMKQELVQNSDKEEVITLCMNLVLIATGGASFYQRAFADVQRQRRILLGPPEQKTPGAALAALVEKYVPSISQAEPKQQDGKMTYRRLALLHIYQGLAIPRDKSVEIARKHGFDSRTSGTQLCESYNTLFRSPSQRTGFESKREINCMIDDISFVINLLPSDERKQAKNELQTLISKRNTPL